MKDLIEILTKYEQQCPEVIAVRHRDETLTYAQLGQYSNQLAAKLRDTEAPVVLYGHMSPYMIVGMVAAIKAGCGYVPIDTSIPINRIDSILDKVQPQYIFNTANDTISFKQGEVLTPEIIDQDAASEAIAEMSQTDICYTIFTSGSTGEPKGVQISYSSLLEFTQWMVELNDSEMQQQWLNQAPFSFDLSVMAIYPALMSAGTLNLVDKTMIHKPKELSDMLEQHPIDVWVSTPSFMEMCLLLPQLTETHYPSLHRLFFCGEILTHRTAQQLVQRFPNATVYNTYGPTEATVAVTYVKVTQALLDQYSSLPVGISRKGAELNLTEEDELTITGNSVSYGYLQNPDKTNEVFDTTGEERVYYTGDKAQFKDGLWFIHGRLDFQVKLNGYRMELEEIETNLRQTPYIESTVVVPIYRGDKVTSLSAAVVLNSTLTEQLSEQAVIQETKLQLKSVLPEYMIPKKFVTLAQLPMTPNGKVDRKAIAEVVTR